MKNSGETTFYSDFKKLFMQEKYSLPIRWDGEDFVATLRKFFNFYLDEFVTLFEYGPGFRELQPTIRKVTNEIIESLELYLDGKPSEAFLHFDKLFSEQLMVNQFSIYKENFDPRISENNKRRISKLFRTRRVEENREYKITEIFHTPFNLRNKIGTNRYSIAGYPSLYLSSSLELSLEELEYEINPGRYICSHFELRDDSNPTIIELGIKPNDFALTDKTKKSKRQEQLEISIDDRALKNYCVWYPLIAACSFIRINRKDPFAIEYVIPQLLMLSVRNLNVNNRVVGIRYFSCSSIRSSELGFNYVFPTSHTKEDDGEFCLNLLRTFKSTKPLLLNEYKGVANCETALRSSTMQDIV